MGIGYKTLHFVLFLTNIHHMDYIYDGFTVLFVKASIFIHSYGTKDPRHVQINFVFHRRKNVIWVWNNMIIFIFGRTMHLKTCHNAVNVDPCAGLCWWYMHIINGTQANQSDLQRNELKAAYISLSGFNQAPRLLCVHIIHCPNERKHLKPHSFMCLNCFHQQSWSLCSYWWPTEVPTENNKNTSTANRRIIFHSEKSEFGALALTQNIIQVFQNNKCKKMHY